MDETLDELLQSAAPEPPDMNVRGFLEALRQAEGEADEARLIAAAANETIRHLAEALRGVKAERDLFVELSADAQAEATGLAVERDAWKATATTPGFHLFNGACPDGLQGPDVRDPHCSGCAVLDDRPDPGLIPCPDCGQPADADAHTSGFTSACSSSRADVIEAAGGAA